MKFVNTKTTRDYALELAQKQETLRRLKAKIKRLEPEVEQLEDWLMKKHHESFQFADDEGYLMQATLVEGSREVLDQDRVVALVNKLGRLLGKVYKLPMKRVSWAHLRIAHVKE